MLKNIFIHIGRAIANAIFDLWEEKEDGEKERKDTSTSKTRAPGAPKTQKDPLAPNKERGDGKKEKGKKRKKGRKKPAKRNRKKVQ